MLPLIPFIAGVAAGVVAANAWRRGDVQGGLQRASRAMRDAADESMRRVRRSSAQWRARWEAAADGDAPAADAGDDIEMVNAAGDEPDADAPRRRSSSARRGGGRRRMRREEPDSGFDEDDAPAGEADGEGSEDGERA